MLLADNAWVYTEVCLTRVYGQVLWALSSTDCVCAAGATSVVKLVTLLESAGRISILEYFGAM